MNYHNSSDFKQARKQDWEHGFLRPNLALFSYIVGLFSASFETLVNFHSILFKLDYISKLTRKLSARFARASTFLAPAVSFLVD